MKGGIESGIWSFELRVEDAGGAKVESVAEVFRSEMSERKEGRRDVEEVYECSDKARDRAQLLDLPRGANKMGDRATCQLRQVSTARMCSDTDTEQLTVKVSHPNSFACQKSNGTAPTSPFRTPELVHLIEQRDTEVLGTLAELVKKCMILVPNQLLPQSAELARKGVLARLVRLVAMLADLCRAAREWTVALDPALGVIPRVAKTQIPYSLGTGNAETRWH